MSIKIENMFFKKKNISHYIALTSFIFGMSFFCENIYSSYDEDADPFYEKRSSQNNARFTDLDHSFFLLGHLHPDFFISGFEEALASLSSSQGDVEIDYSFVLTHCVQLITPILQMLLTQEEDDFHNSAPYHAS